MFLYFLSILLLTWGKKIPKHQRDWSSPSGCRGWREDRACWLHAVGAGEEAKPKGSWALTEFYIIEPTETTHAAWTYKSQGIRGKGT